jgi:CBS domain-containing protein
MNAGEVMTVGVTTVRPDASVTEAARLMVEHGVSGLPVVDAHGQLVGIVTEGDFLRRTETGTERRRPRWLEFLLGSGRLANEYVHSHARKIQEIMTPDVITVFQSTPLQDVVTVMERHRIKRVPVLDGEKLVGIISRANLVQALARLAEEASPSQPDDEAMRRQILNNLNRERWTPKDALNVIVRNGVAELWGVILDERERQAIKVVAENVPGINAVRDHLVFVGPMSGVVLESPEDAWRVLNDDEQSSQPGNHTPECE